MKRDELIDAFSHVDDKYLRMAEKLPKEENVAADARRMKRTYTRGRKMIFRIAMAAAAFVMLAGVAYAANIFGLRDALISRTDAELSGIVEVDGKDELVTVQERKISLAGTEGSPEFMASEEWLVWEASYEASQPEDGSWIDDSWIPSDPSLVDVSQYYMVYNDEMLDKLIEIAEKYSLKLHSEMELLAGEFLYTAVNGTLITPYNGYIYEDGSFLMDAEYDGNVLQILRNKAGTLPAANLSVWNPDENTEYSYVTDQGYTVDIMQLANMNKTKIFYSDGKTFIILNAFIGDEQSAKELADAINFEALCK